MFAMALMEAERSRLKVFAFDEGWRLLGDPIGRLLLASLQRMGRSELAVPIISTQLVGDALLDGRESFENLLGATFVFGLRSEREAERALALLDLDPDDRALRDALLEFDAGRCLMRDHRGRVEAVQVEVAAPRLLRALSTTPPPRGRRRRGRARLVGLADAAPALAAAPRRRFGRAEPARVERLREPVVHRRRGSSLQLSATEQADCADLRSRDRAGAARQLRDRRRHPVGPGGELRRGRRHGRAGPPRHARLDRARCGSFTSSLIALEWCYSLELLTPATLARAAGVLGGARRVFTDPWLGLVLAVAAVGFAWQGLVRRRVLDTLGRRRCSS